MYMKGLFTRLREASVWFRLRIYKQHSLVLYYINRYLSHYCFNNVCVHAIHIFYSFLFLLLIVIGWQKKIAETRHDTKKEILKCPKDKTQSVVENAKLLCYDSGKRKKTKEYRQFEATDRKLTRPWATHRTLYIQDRAVQSTPKHLPQRMQRLNAVEEEWVLIRPPLEIRNVFTETEFYKDKYIQLQTSPQFYDRFTTSEYSVVRDPARCFRG